MAMKLSSRGRPSGGWRRSAAALLLVVVPLPGCYRTAPLATPAPDAGTQVVAILTEQGSQEMAALIGPGAASVEGVVAEARDGEWDLLLTRVEHARGTDVFWNRERVVFPSRVFASVGERRLDQRRTVIFAAGFTAALVAAGRIFGIGVFGRDENGGGGTIPIE